jgi:polysaccharide export outer membrane protein
VIEIKTYRRIIAAATLLCFGLSLVPQAPSAQVKPDDASYRFVIGDHLLISVPARPSFNREVTIDANGNILLPLVGPLAVAGLTATEINAKIYLALHEYYPSLEPEDLTVEPAKGLTIYVTGEVGVPGKYMFQTPPNLWAAMREAGGPTGNAALSDVRIVKDGTKGGESRVVDVQHAVDNGTVDSLPPLEEGDTVIVGSTEGTTYTGSFGVNIFGEVNSPGMYRLQTKQDLASALLLAGGPTERANLSDVKVVRARPEGGFQTYELNLDDYLKKGKSDQNIMLQAGDTVSIARQNSWAYAFKTNPALLVTVLVSLTTIAVLITRDR